MKKPSLPARTRLGMSAACAGRDAGLARVGLRRSRLIPPWRVDAQRCPEQKREIVVLVDPALRPVSQDWLQHLVMQAIRPGVGAVGPALWRLQVE